MHPTIGLKARYYSCLIESEINVVRRETIRRVRLSAKEPAKQAASSTALSLSCSFRLNPFLQEGPVLQVIKPRNLGLLLRLLSIECQQCRDRIDHVSQRNATHAAEVRTIHFDLNERHSAFFLSNAIFLHQLPDQRRDDLARAAPIGLPESQERRSRAC